MWIKRKLLHFVYREPDKEESTPGEESPIKNDTGEVEGTGNEARVARMNAIADSADQEREDELLDVNDDGTTEPFKAKVPEEPEELAEPEKKEPQPEPEPEPEVRKFKIKVNGKELELTEQELVDRAQKVESADDYLRQVKARIRQEQPKPQAGPTKEELQRFQDEEDRALVRAIQMGTEEEAAAAIRKLREQTARSVATPSVNTDDLIRSVDERLAFTRARDKFEQEFKDIVGDPYLYKLMLERDSAQLEDQDTRPYLERWTEIGNELRTWVKKFGPKEEEKPASEETPKTLKAKLERKEQAPREPVKANRKNTPPSDEDEEDESTSTVIKKMAEARGGPQWMRN